MNASAVVGRNVKMLRKAQKLSQADLANRMAWSDIQMHQTTVAKLEGGKRPTSVDELVVLSMILGVAPAFLLESGLSVEDLQAQALPSEDDLRARVVALDATNARLRSHLRGIAATATAASADGGAA